MKRPLPALLALACLLPAVAAGDREPTAPSVVDSRRAKAIQAGLRYLARQQARDGSFGPKSGVVGITALSALALMAQGHQENRGPYGDHLRRGVDFLLKCSLESVARGKPGGYIYVAGDNDSRMHGHGYATQVLVLAYGANRVKTDRSLDLRRKIQRALAVIEASQTMTGGWGYEPNDSSFHEGSVTVTVVQALRVARDAGFRIDTEVVKRGLKYLHESQNKDGSFKYALLEPRSSPALTAAAITAMHGFGEYYSDSIRAGLGYLTDRYRARDGNNWPFYANYYAAQAFFRAGGRHWRFWQTEVVPRILAAQNRGSWDDQEYARAPGTHGRTYATALSCLALSVQDGYLPLFQK